MLALLVACQPAPESKESEETAPPVEDTDTAADTHTDDSETDRGHTDTADTEPDTGEVPHPNWTDDVGPWVVAECGDCHREGGIGPFRLDTWATAVKAAEESYWAMAGGTMPPFLVDNTGECHSYADARVVSPEQLEQFQAWIALGAPLGPGVEPTPDPEPALAEVDATLDIGGDYTPDLTAGDKYRCFPVEWGFAGNKFLTAYTTTPGDASIVHHTTVYTLNDASEADRMLELDALDETPGFECPNGPIIEEIDLVAVWNPGTGVTDFPGESGILVNGDLPGLIRIHYSGGGSERTDRTTMELDMEDEVTIFGYMLGLDDRALSIEPGLPDAQATSDYHLLSYGVKSDVNVWGVNPHMHQRGYAMELTRDPDGAAECLERLAYWDYQWQQMFWYDAPLTVTPGELLRLTCTYDTTAETTEITYGQASTSEMCLTILYVTPQ